MKLVSCFLLSAFVLSSQQPAATPQEPKPEDLSAIEGQVLSSATGAPIRKAELHLRGADRPSSGARIPAAYSAISDSGGNFTIEGIEPGKYRLSVHRTGFVDMQYGARGPARPGTILALGTGQRLKDLVFRVIPQAVITGRIVDENNEPVASVSVEVLRYSFVTGKKQLLSSGMGSTNDLGEYRIYGLAPGRYYLKASLETYMDETAVDRSAFPAAESYVPTYYPGSAAAAAAVPLEVSAGAQLRGMNLTLAKARTFRVSGRVAGWPNVTVEFFPRGLLRWASGDEQHVTDQKGNFEINDVLPGAYTLTVSGWKDDNVYSARQDVDVGENNVENIALALTPGSEISGQFVVEGQAQPNLDAVSVYLRPRERGDMYPGMAKRLHDGAFTISNVGSEVYTLLVDRLPDGYWIKSVQMGSQEVKETGIDLTHGPAGPLTVTIAPNAGQIDGAVLNDQQQPAPGASVVLVPEPRLRDHTEAYKTTTSDQNGRFTLKNIEPGEYKLFAWEDVEYGAYMDPDFLRPVEDRGQSMSIHEGSRESVQINVIPADAAGQDRTEGRQVP
jgi:Carboxypeptidase regulatory-like domain